MGDFFLKDLSAIFIPTRRKPGHSPDPTRLVSDSGTKAAPLLRSGNIGCVILSVSYRHVSAALSLQNKVYNSIYSMSVFYSVVFYVVRSCGSSMCGGTSTGQNRHVLQQ
jgi:hypothetical protein